MQTPVDWEKVSVAPVMGPDGKTSVPPEVIDSMTRNKVGLKGELWGVGGELWGDGGELWGVGGELWGVGG